MKKMSYQEKLRAISEAKQTFEKFLEKELSLIKVGAPLFVRSDTWLQDDLNWIEKSVSFEKSWEKFEIVHSLAKWKRMALWKYGFSVWKGLYTEMKAIRKDEIVDPLHSMYVEQYDWEKVIAVEDRTMDYLKETVDGIYKSFLKTISSLSKKYPFLYRDLPKKIKFISSQELEDRYPSKTAEEREYLAAKEYKAIFITWIWDKLKSGKVHGTRSPDYDDWGLDWDWMMYDEKFDRVIELSSMWIRVSEKSLVEQLKKSDKMEKIWLPYHQSIIKKELPYSIWWGIGMTRLIMFILWVYHIAEVQASSRELKTLREIKDLEYM